MADTSQATYEPVVKLPKPPKHLGKIAAEAWSTCGKELIDSSVLCVTDLAALEQFAKQTTIARKNPGFAGVCE